jgi:hypothetical protein
MDKKLLFAVILCVCALSVSAFNFDVSVSPESAAIKSNERAEFNITITHDSDVNQTFNIYSPDVQWDVPSTSVVAQSGVQTTITLKIKQYVDNLNLGYYLVPVHIRPLMQDSVIRKNLLISLRGEGQQTYLPSLRVKLTMPTSVDPRETSSAFIELTSLNRLDVKDVTVRLRSNLVNTDISMDVTGLNTARVEVPIILNAMTAHQMDEVQLNAFITLDNRTYRFDGEPATYEVAEYGEIVASTGETSNMFGSLKTISFYNNGNTQKSQTYRVEKPGIKSWFMKTTPSASIVKDNDGTWYVWDLTLPSGGTTTAAVTADYTIIYVLIGVLIVIYLLYLLFRSPVLIEKNAVVVGTKEGGLTDIKVLIEVKNRSNRVLKNVRMLDKIPHIVHLVEEHGVGTLRPAKVVRSDETGTLLSWNLNELDKLEERVVSYRIRTKLSIVGRLHLPVSVVKFEKTPGRTRSTKSNISQIGFGQ